MVSSNTTERDRLVKHFEIIGECLSSVRVIIGAIRLDLDTMGLRKPLKGVFGPKGFADVEGHLV